MSSTVGLEYAEWNSIVAYRGRCRTLAWSAKSIIAKPLRCWFDLSRNPVQVMNRSISALKSESGDSVSTNPPETFISGPEEDKL